MKEFYIAILLGIICCVFYVHSVYKFLNINRNKRSYFEYEKSGRYACYAIICLIILLISGVILF